MYFTAQRYQQDKSSIYESSSIGALLDIYADALEKKGTSEDLEKVTKRKTSMDPKFMLEEKRPNSHKERLQWIQKLMLAKKRLDSHKERL